jgi:hypothetical protein
MGVGMFCQISRTPCIMRLLKDLLNNNISHQATVSAIAIRKAVNAYQTMFESDGGFIGTVSVVGIPKSYIIQQVLQLRGYLVFVNPNIFIGLAKLTGPCPYIALHAFMDCL